MDIVELKNNIENKTLDNSFMIWQVIDDSSRIITKQYINEISKFKNFEIKSIDDLNEIPDESFIEDNNLYILNTLEYNKPESHSNTIVICEKTKDKRAIKFPKLENWQVIDYVLSFAIGLTKQDLEYFIEAYDGNYWRFISDFEKISSFNPKQQKLILDEMLGEGQFDTISNYKIWDLSNAIIKRDPKLAKNILKVIEYIDVEPLGLAKVLYNNFKTIVSIQTNPKITANDLGISDKQYWVIKKYNCGFYSNEQLIQILKLLTNIEYMFKYGEIPINNLIDYMTCKILGV